MIRKNKINFRYCALRLCNLVMFVDKGIKAWGAKLLPTSSYGLRPLWLFLSPTESTAWLPVSTGSDNPLIPQNAIFQWIQAKRNALATVKNFGSRVMKP